MNPCKKYKIEMKLFYNKLISNDYRERRYSQDDRKKANHFHQLLLELYYKPKCIKWFNKIKKYKNKRKFKR